MIGVIVEHVDLFIVGDEEAVNALDCHSKCIFKVGMIHIGFEILVHLSGVHLEIRLILLESKGERGIVTKYQHTSSHEVHHTVLVFGLVGLGSSLVLTDFEFTEMNVVVFNDLEVVLLLATENLTSGRQ